MVGFEKHKVRLGVGILISIFFLYLAFRKVNIVQMWQALGAANYWYLVPAVAIVFFSHFLRAFRWRYLLDPIRRLDTSSLFSSLIIGYMANVFIPAHLGEILRAYVLSKKRQIPVASTLATIFIERIIDVFSLLALMLLAIFVHPFPAWVTKSGYTMFVAAMALLVFLILLKVTISPTMRVVDFVMKPLPDLVARKVQKTIENFRSGLLPLRRWHDYFTVGILSVIIWACYGFVFHLSLHAFSFPEKFHLEWSVSLILLVITTIAVAVPSSPGYVGTYHYLCQVTLAMFGVPDGKELRSLTRWTRSSPHQPLPGAGK